MVPLQRAMKGITVAILGDPALGAMLAKKGTESDLRFFNLKREQGAITYIEPTRYPDKVQSLIYALAMSDAVILSVEKLDKALGEQIVAIDSVGISTGLLILQNYVQPEDTEPLTKDTSLSKFNIIERDPIKINDTILGMQIPAKDGPVNVPVDHFFNVKGVGIVALGCVRRGVVRKHDDLQIYPTEKKASVRSIQVHDNDVPEAGFGNRVGLALKNVEMEDLDRGVILAPSGSMDVSDHITFDFFASKFWKAELKKDTIIHAAIGLQIKPAKVEDVFGGSLTGGKKGSVTLKFDKPVAYNKSDRIVLLDLDTSGLRVAGWGELA